MAFSLATTLLLQSREDDWNTLICLWQDGGSTPFL